MHTKSRISLGLGFALYWDACDLFEHKINANAPYISATIENDVRDKLDQAIGVYSRGMVRASFANLGTDAKDGKVVGEAMTYYAKAQICTQMAKTALLKARQRA